MWELVDGARWLANCYRRGMRSHPDDPHFRQQVERHLRRARNHLIRIREIESAIRHAK